MNPTVGDPKTSKNMSRIETLVAYYQTNPEMRRPVSWNEYLLRMEKISRLALQGGVFESEGEVNNFSRERDVSPTLLRMITGMISSRMQRGSFKKEMHLPVPVVREMTLIAFEAKPRLVSLAMGFTSSDFICYTYQDVIKEAMVLEGAISASASTKSFTEMLPDMKRWMRQAPARKGLNSARRHIRRRIMALLDRTNHQVAALFSDKEMSSDLECLIQKLMERDDDVGYTQGMIRDFEAVRNDFNVLAEHCRSIRISHNLGLTSNDDTLLSRIVCPASVVDLTEYQLDLPRGPSSGTALKKAAAKNKTLAKTKKPRGQKSGDSDLIVEHNALLDALKKI